MRIERVIDHLEWAQEHRAGVFAAPDDPSLFCQVFIEHGTVTWPGEIDLAPDAMCAEIQREVSDRKDSRVDANVILR